jgi:hypothetical protein
MELPYPICCSLSLFKNGCEKAGCCVNLGKIGLRSFSENRAKIMFVAAGFSFLAFILCIVSVCSLSYTNSQVKNTNWTYGKSDDSEYFVGLYEIIVKTKGYGEVELQWSDGDCPNSYCEDCQDACNSSISSVIIALITCIPTIQTDLQRSTVKGDLNCQKIMGMFTGLMGTISTLIALSAYADGCYRNLPDNDGAGNNIVWELGPGFSCLLVATLLKPIDFLIHLLMPVEKPAEESEDLTKSASQA